MSDNHDHDGQSPDPENGDDLDINTVDRFRKRSTKLILEHHSHCEVPAGCGGVVMRWRDPRDGVPLIVEWFSVSAHTLEGHVDGEQRGGYMVLALGAHELELRIEVSGEEPCAFAVCVRSGGALRGEIDGCIPELSTAADGSWSCTVDDEAAVVKPIGLDDLNLEGNDLWRVQRFLRQGVTVLHVDAADGAVVTVRKTLQVSDAHQPPTLPETT